MNGRLRVSLLLTVLCLSFASALPALAVGDGCATADTLTAVQRTQLAGLGSDPAPSEYFCQDVSGVSSELRSQRCIDNACSGGANIKCCKPSTGGRPGAGAGGGAETGGGAGVGTGALLPSCAETGDCGLDDIVQTGVNFANFLFGISGAVFLAIFVYAGILYLTAGGNTSRVADAKKKLVDATIGMILVIAAGALVTFVYNAFLATGRGGTTADRCAATHPTYSCQVLTAENLEAEISARGCVRGLCPGSANNVCCPSGGGSSSADLTFCFTNADCPSGLTCSGATADTQGVCE